MELQLVLAVRQTVRPVMSAVAGVLVEKDLRAQGRDRSRRSYAPPERGAVDRFPTLVPSAAGRVKDFALGYSEHRCWKSRCHERERQVLAAAEYHVAAAVCVEAEDEVGGCGDVIGRTVLGEAGELD